MEVGNWQKEEARGTDEDENTRTGKSKRNCVVIYQW